MARLSPRSVPFLLIDISNTFTKVAFSSAEKIAQVKRIPTAELSVDSLRKVISGRIPGHAVVASVAPKKNKILQAALDCRISWVNSGLQLGFKIKYPKPETLGADRLANVAACAALYGAPAIVMDFGTASTFDVLLAGGIYSGGVIAPGLPAMTEYLSTKTALLPRVVLKEPRRAVGKSTTEAMLSGAMHGYRGLVREVIEQIGRESFPKSRPRLIATGGDAALIAKGLPIFDVVNPQLTLEGLRIIGRLNLGS